MSPEDKTAWLRVGEGFERDFVSLARSLCIPVAIHPDKQVSPYGPDLIFDGRIPADLKRQKTMFRMADSFSDVPPHRAVTLNMAPLRRYRGYAQFRIYFWVTYPGTSTNGIWHVDAGAAKPRGEVIYKNRVGDPVNNQSSYILSLDDMVVDADFSGRVLLAAA